MIVQKKYVRNHFNDVNYEVLCQELQPYFLQKLDPSSVYEKYSTLKVMNGGSGNITLLDNQIAVAKVTQILDGYDETKLDVSLSVTPYFSIYTKVGDKYPCTELYNFYFSSLTFTNVTNTNPLNNTYIIQYTVYEFL